MSVELPTTPQALARTKRGIPAALSGRLAVAAAAVRAHPLPTVLIGLGVGFRVGRFLQDRSLWLDEAYLALNLTTRSYSSLRGTLDFEQGAPVGFLMLEKFAISVFGDSERSLRLFPLLAGIASLFVFWRVALRFLDRTSALLALAFFTVLEPFVYYSSETKQYSFDVLFALVVLWLFDRALRSKGLRWSAAFLVAGVAAPWFSHPAVFVLAGTGIALVLAAAVERHWRKAMLVSVAGGLWLASFAAVYAISTRHLNPQLSSGLRGETADRGRVLKNVYVLFNYPGTMPRDAIALMLMLAALGALVLLRRRWSSFAALALTALAAVSAGELQRYPLSGRWALFLLPPAILLFALGATSLVRTTRMPLRAVALAAVVALLAVPSWRAVRDLDSIPKVEEGTPATSQPTKKLLGRLERLWLPRDTLYVSLKSQYQFRYYLTCHDCNPRRDQQARLWPFRTASGPGQTSPALVPTRSSLVVGSAGDLGSYLDEFAGLRGKERVWLLFLQTWPVDEQLLEFSLNRQGRPLTVMNEGASTLLLYDLSRKPLPSVG